jgi:hypothetical protein
VTLVEAADRLVPLDDADANRHLTHGLKKRDIGVRAGARPLDAAVLHLLVAADGGRGSERGGDTRAGTRSTSTPCRGRLSPKA